MLVAMGVAVEQVQLVLARSAYQLANKRVIEVFGYASGTLHKYLASLPSIKPALTGGTL
jgi:hypothetical protein